MNSLIIFVKNPIAGTVKTRLAKIIGDEKATNFYKELLKYTKSFILPITDLTKNVYYGDFVNAKDLWNENDFKKHLQTGKDLGERMKNAFGEQFACGAEKVIIIGSDCLEIQEKHILGAIKALNRKDVVFGPAKDGGYYLLGMKKLHHFIFNKKPWSTDKLLQLTLEDLTERKISYQLLDKLSDIDEYADYEACMKSKIYPTQNPERVKF